MTLLAALRRIGSHLRAGHRIGCETCARRRVVIREIPYRGITFDPDDFPEPAAAPAPPRPDTGTPLAAGSPSLRDRIVKADPTITSPVYRALKEGRRPEATTPDEHRRRGAL